MNPMVLLGDVGQVEARFDPFGDIVILMQDSCTVCTETYHRIGYRFGRTQWNSLVTWVMWSLVSVRLQTVLVLLVLVQDRCTVCAKRTIGSEIVLDATDGTPR